MNNQKKLFSNIFIILALILVVIPFTTTFNDVLTRIIIKFDAFNLIQKYVVPWEVRMIGVILYPFGLYPSVAGEYLSLGKDNPYLIEIAWNCVGWQSLIFFILTSWIGLQGNQYTFFSKLKTLSIGILGTFLVNLLRIVIVIIVTFNFGQRVAIIFHDYGSTLISIAWLIFFWWFSYSYVLEERNVEERIQI